MKFFTPEACRTFQDAEAFKVAHEGYLRHLRALGSQLPPNVHALAMEWGVRDGLIVRVDHDREQGAMRLVLRCGDLHHGYFNLELTYRGAEILPSHDAALAEIARSTQTAKRFDYAVLFQELDATGAGGVEHRLIFRRGRDDKTIWFGVTCGELSWRRTPKQSRRLPPIPDRYLRAQGC